MKKIEKVNLKWFNETTKNQIIVRLGIGDLYSPGHHGVKISVYTKCSSYLFSAQSFLNLDIESYEQARNIVGIRKIDDISREFEIWEKHWPAWMLQKPQIACINTRQGRCHDFHAGNAIFIPYYLNFQTQLANAIQNRKISPNVLNTMFDRYEAFFTQVNNSNYQTLKSIIN